MREEIVAKDKYIKSGDYLWGPNLESSIFGDQTVNFVENAQLGGHVWIWKIMVLHRFRVREQSSSVSGLTGSSLFISTSPAYALKLGLSFNEEAISVF